MGSGCQPQHLFSSYSSHSLSNSLSNSHSSNLLFDCKVWLNLTSQNFIYPEYDECHEFNQKLNIGVALSGGGFRAATCALGALRGLYLLKNT